VIVGVVLAAGGAARFGSQKLLAPLRGLPLVTYAVDMLLATTDSVIVVVGNDGDDVRRALGSRPVSFAENADWRDGQSTSLRCGIAAAPHEAKAVVIALGDQPDCDPAVVVALIARWRDTGCSIVTARYRGVQAPPALLAREVFEEVEMLRGDVGARPLIDRTPERVAYVDVAADVRDVDTPSDLAALE
jgi:CTP:molybdopterin cytidylyltransferase MocA